MQVLETWVAPRELDLRGLLVVQPPRALMVDSPLVSVQEKAVAVVPLGPYSLLVAIRAIFWRVVGARGIRYILVVG